MADEGGEGVDVEEGADPGLEEVDMDSEVGGAGLASLKCKWCQSTEHGHSQCTQRRVWGGFNCIVLEEASEASEGRVHLRWVGDGAVADTWEDADKLKTPSAVAKAIDAEAKRDERQRKAALKRKEKEEAGKDSASKLKRVKKVKVPTKKETTAISDVQIAASREEEKRLALLFQPFMAAFLTDKRRADEGDADENGEKDPAAVANAARKARSSVVIDTRLREAIVAFEKQHCPRDSFTDLAVATFASTSTVDAVPGADAGQDAGHGGKEGTQDAEDDVDMLEVGEVDAE
jgi:hypothetical protein